jgi:calcium/proton exchanger cax
VLVADTKNHANLNKDLAKAKLTMAECVVALLLAISLVSLLAVFLVEEIEPMVEKFGVPENFIGLILVPLVEKAAEHLTAVDEAWDNQIVSSRTIRAPPLIILLTLQPRRTLPCFIAWALRFRPRYSTHHWSS